MSDIIYTTHTHTHTYTDAEWKSLADLAKQQSLLSGFYNKNYRLVHDGTAFLFRFPKSNEKQMDPRPLYEGDICRAISKEGLSVPKLIYDAPDRTFQVHEFIQGSLVDTIYPPGQRIPNEHISQIAQFYAKMAHAEIDVSSVLAQDWPRRGPQLTFFEKLLETSWIIYSDHKKTHGMNYEFLGLPDDPFSLFLAKAAKLTKRPWRLIHGDIHRGNLIEKEDGVLVIIDWELAMYGDVIYCIAAHLHRSRYYSDEKYDIARAIYDAMPPVFQKNFMSDLEFYLEYEALKSVLTDTIRFPDLLKHKTVSQDTLYELSVYYADNLNRIAPILKTKTAQPEQVLKWFEEWAE